MVAFVEFFGPSIAVQLIRLEASSIGLFGSTHWFFGRIQNFIRAQVVSFMKCTKVILRVILTVLCLFQISCVLAALNDKKDAEPAPPSGYGSLAKLPFAESWFGLYFYEDKVGYSHYKIEPAGEDFVIHTEAYIRLTAQKKTNEITTKETQKVKPDLTLISTESETKINDKTLKMSGTVQADKFVVQMDVEGEKINKELHPKGPLYGTVAISLIAPLQGLKEGRTVAFTIFNPEKQMLENLEQTVSSVPGGPGPQGAAWKVRTSYVDYAKRTADFWLDKQGRTVLDKSLDGALITLLEDEESARKFAEKKSATKDIVLDQSLIKVPALPAPESLKHLKVKVSGIDADLIPDDYRQTKTLDPDGSFMLTVNTEDPKKIAHGPAGSRPDLSEALESTVVIPSDHAEIVSQAAKIVSRNDPLDKILQLCKWTAANIAAAPEDSFSALTVLRTRKGECQAHANLYAALARSQQVPTRIVGGIVYSKQDGGFLYHAWAESYVNGWVSVDPTFNQVPADATHIKIYAGNPAVNDDKLLRTVKKIRIEVPGH